MFSGLKKNEELSRLPLEKKEYVQIGDRLVMLKSQEHICNTFPCREKPLAYDDSVYDYEATYKKSIGSYGTYNWFRGVLEDFSARIRDMNNILDPFGYITEFSDCEGVFGSECCFVLGNEFRVFEEAFKNYVETSFDYTDYDILMTMYRKFKDAFAFGAKGGAVEFC